MSSGGSFSGRSVDASMGQKIEGWMRRWKIAEFGRPPTGRSSNRVEREVQDVPFLVFLQFHSI